MKIPTLLSVEDEIRQKASSFHSPALLFANPKNLYQRRAKRLRDLAKNSPLQDYLLLAANLVEQQLFLLENHPIEKDPRLSQLNAEQLANQPLNVKNWQRAPVWQELLSALLDLSKPVVNEPTLNVIENLEKMSFNQIEELADNLLAQDFHLVDPAQAVFIWAALSLYWLQLVQQIPHNAIAENGENLQFCPVCNSSPVSSVVHLGAQQGLRYLHCSLCETEWNLVRSKCSNCDQTGKLDYWSLDSEFASVKSESCSDCHSYLKILYQERDPHVEAVADDLANLFLDVEMEEKGFYRSGVNPFLFPSEEI